MKPAKFARAPVFNGERMVARDRKTQSLTAASHGARSRHWQMEAAHSIMKPRSGFTVIELLISLAIISLLLGLTLPAVQRVREVSRSAACSSRLRQLGVACQSFETTHRHFPDYGGPDGYIRWSHAVLLDHLGYAALSSQLPWDLSDQGGIDISQDGPPVVPWPSDVWKTPISDFVCPSDTTPLGGNNFRASYGTIVSDTHTWKPGMGPRPADVFNESLNGILRAAASPAQVTDGLSNTVLYSERIVGDGDHSRYTPSRDIAGFQTAYFHWPNDAIIFCSGTTPPTTIISYSGWTWAIGGGANHSYNHVATPNSRIPDCLAGPGNPIGIGVFSARSWHPGGVNVVFADGATRFIADHIDLRVWRGLGTMYGAEVLSDSDF